MDLGIVIKGVVVGFSIAAPVGPVGIICLQRTLKQGRLAGLVSGLGAATADALYGLLAGLGVSALSSTLLSLGPFLRPLGGGYLLFLGLRIFLSRSGSKGNKEENGGALTGPLAAFGSVFLLTLTNPMTILSFSAVMAGLQIKGGGAGLLVLGVFCGSALWWLTLALAGGWLKDRTGPGLTTWINRASGVAIVCFGILILAGIGSQG